MRVAFSRIVLNTNSRSPGDLEIRSNISEFAASRSSASSRSWVRRATTVLSPATEAPRLRVTFGALPRFGVADLPRRDFTAPERRFIALPKVRTGIVAAQISAVEVAGQAFGLITSAGRA